MLTDKRIDQGAFTLPVEIKLRGKHPLNVYLLFLSKQLEINEERYRSDPHIPIPCILHGVAVKFPMAIIKFFNYTFVK